MRHAILGTLTLWIACSILEANLVSSQGTGNSPSRGTADILAGGSALVRGVLAPQLAPAPALPPVELPPTTIAPLSADEEALGTPVTGLSSSAKSLNLAPTAAVLAASTAPASSANNVGNGDQPSETINTVDAFPTQCIISILGRTDGTGLRSANITCQGPGAPIVVAGSKDIAPFSNDFQGVNFTVGTQLGNVLEFNNINNVAVINSRMTSEQSGAIAIYNSNMQVLGSRFDGNYGSTSGAMLVSGASSVLIDACLFANNTGTSGGALVINGESQVAVTNSSFQYNLNANSQGGGLSAAGGYLGISSSSFIGNRASLGGGIYVSSGNATFDDVTFTDNYAGSTGGGAYTLNANLELSNSTFRGNVAGSLGGAMVQDGTTFTVMDTIFDLNRAQSQGGAVYQTNATGSFSSSTFSNNTASNGGALFQDLGAGDVTLCLFVNNTAAETGGALLQTNSNSNLNNCTFNNNQAGQYGGAVLQSNVASSINFCIFQGSTGGALYRNACLGFITSCSFLSNQAKEGGAIYLNNSPQNNVRGTLFKGNKAQQGSALLLNNSVPVVTGCLFDGSTTAGNAIFANNNPDGGSLG